MIGDHVQRTSNSGSVTTLPHRLRSALGWPDPPLPRQRPPRLEPIRRSWLAAALHARLAVHSGVTLDDWLRARLARYLSALPVPRARLPLAVEVDDGQVRTAPVEPAPRPAPPPPEPGAEPWLDSLVEAEGPAVRMEVSELEVRIAVLDGEAEHARRRTEELSRRLAADVAANVISTPGAVEATAEQLGRPPVRSAGPMLVAAGFTLSAAAALTWQVAQPLLRGAGLDPVHLAAELTRRPTEAGFTLAFALAVAVSLFALAGAGLELAAFALRPDGETDPRRRRWIGAAGAAAALLAAAVAVAVARLPAPAAALPPATAALLLAVLPVASSILFRRARAWDEAREREAAAALAWDRERARSLADRARRLEELEWAEEEERGLAAQREACRHRLQELSQRAVAAARRALEADRKERAALARLAQSLAGALEIDRFEFIRQATARGAADLCAPRRRLGGEPLTPAGREATLPAA